jgi:hypothetical protein
MNKKLTKKCLVIIAFEASYFMPIFFVVKQPFLKVGMKTEPAFVAYFGIELGDKNQAFERLYDLYSLSDEELARACGNIQ